MGWISKRHMERGGSIGPGSASKHAKRGPLRKVVSVLRRGHGIFEADRALLDCGHETHTWGGLRAICPECSLAKLEALP